MPRDLRRWLKAVGVIRPALHESTRRSQNLTWHDLRATGATWMAVRGDDPLKIKQRCGHKTFSTTEIYVREGEALRGHHQDGAGGGPCGLATYRPQARGRARSRSEAERRGESSVPRAAHGDTRRT